jgi:hypothetical protein
MNRTAVLYVLISAALFGVSTPAAKALVGSLHPAVLAGPLHFNAVSDFGDQTKKQCRSERFCHFVAASAFNLLQIGAHQGEGL